MKNMMKKTLVLALVLSMMVISSYAAGEFENSAIAIGIKNLISDVSLWLVILSPIVGAAACVACLIRRGMSDEQDGKMWTKRAKTAVLCGVGGMMVSGVITLISSYFV